MSPDGYLLALILFFVAGITDYLDGYLARKYKAVSKLGEILDPIADKILILFVLFGLAINLSSYLIGFVGAAADDPILGRDDVVINPHTSFYSEDALLDLQTTVAGDVLTVLNGGQPKWPANPDVFK
jgi:hypothetical protein